MTIQNRITKLEQQTPKPDVDKVVKFYKLGDELPDEKHSEKTPGVVVYLPYNGRETGGL